MHLIMYVIPLLLSNFELKFQAIILRKTQTVFITHKELVSQQTYDQVNNCSLVDIASPKIDLIFFNDRKK